MRMKLVLLLTLLIGVMTTGCGLPLGNGSEGSPCTNLNFETPGNGNGLLEDAIDFMSCAEGFQCDTSLSILDFVCSIDLKQEIQVIANQLVGAFGLPQGLATIIARAAELWDPVCELLAGRVNSDLIGMCVAL